MKAPPRWLLSQERCRPAGIGLFLPRRAANPSPHGFTLLEVVLAISIAVGMLLVLLFFYQQASNFRAELLRESERLSVVRLLMDRLTTELRSARNYPGLSTGFAVAVSSIEFVKTDLPSRAAWSGGSFGRSLAIETDLRQVRYALDSSLDGTNTVVAGLQRSELPLVPARAVEREEALVLPETATTNAPAFPAIEEIRYLRFRYSDGSAWQDSWSGEELPRGVEITMGFEPLPEGTEADEYPFELFRRVVYLPGSELAMGGTL